MANFSTVPETLRNIKEFILERNPTSLKNVAKTLELTHNILNCRLFILDRKIMTVENGKIIHQSSGFKQHLTILVREAL